jgi:hypothetical protein
MRRLVILCLLESAFIFRGTLAVSRLMAGQKSIVPAPSDRDPAGEISRDIVLQFSSSFFMK